MTKKRIPVFFEPDQEAALKQLALRLVGDENLSGLFRKLAVDALHEAGLGVAK